MNKILKTIMFVMILMLTAGLTACNAETQTTEEKPVVTVSILPQKYFVERIAGDHFQVNVMVQPGASPATYEPTAQQMRALSDSAAYISIGVPFEQVWLEKIASANQEMKMIDSSAGINKQAIAAHDHEEEGHEGEEHDNEGTLDPHIWMSPRLVKQQTETIFAALVTLAPEKEAQFKINLDAFIKDINGLDAEIMDKLSNLEQKEFMIFHPSMGYFAADYGLEQFPIEVGGTEPSAQELGALIDLANEHDIKVIFVQPEFSKRSAETIAQEINGTVAELNVLSPDWLNNIKVIADALINAQ